MAIDTYVADFTKIFLYHPRVVAYNPIGVLPILLYARDKLFSEYKSAMAASTKKPPNNNKKTIPFCLTRKPHFWLLA